MSILRGDILRLKAVGTNPGLTMTGILSRVLVLFRRASPTPLAAMLLAWGLFPFLSRFVAASFAFRWRQIPLRRTPGEHVPPGGSGHRHNARSDNGLVRTTPKEDKLSCRLLWSLFPIPHTADRDPFQTIRKIIILIIIKNVALAAGRVANLLLLRKFLRRRRLDGR